MGQEVGHGAAPVAFHQLYNEVCDKLNLFKSEPPSFAKLSGKVKEIKESIEKYKVAYGIEEHADSFIPPFIFEELLEDLRSKRDYELTLLAIEKTKDLINCKRQKKTSVLHGHYEDSRLHTGTFDGFEKALETLSNRRKGAKH